MSARRYDENLPLMSCVVPSSQMVNAEVHERFLESLSECFTPETDVIVISSDLT